MELDIYDTELEIQPGTDYKYVIHRTGFSSVACRAALNLKRALYLINYSNFCVI